VTVPQISDDLIGASIESQQLLMQRERGADLSLFSPRAAGTGHHLGTASVSLVGPAPATS
jgi:4-oxalmesaconate hydratase